MKRIIACLLIVSFFGQNLYSASGQIGPVNPAPLNFNPPVLRYLSVNSVNPFNYFNFLLDQGDSLLNKSQLDSHAKELIHYFFLGLTLPDEAFWVNLKPDEPGRITSQELSQTDLGQALLRQDLQLKRDVAQYLHPQAPKGKEFWIRLYETIGKDKAKKAEITTSNRVWIVPDEAVVMETEDGALVTSAKLKVLLESEYLQIKNKKPGLFSKEDPFSESQKQDLQTISENLMKEIVLPEITRDINTSPTYAPLRQIYHSLILAQWFKRKIKNQNANIKNENQNPYALAIDKGWVKGLESELPWSKQALWQEYVESYQKGEYKVKEKLAGLNRMYVSGGIVFFGEGGVGSGSLTIIPLGKNANSPVTGKESLLPLLTLSSPLVPESGNFPYTEVSVIGKELTAGSPAVTEVDSASSGVEFTDAGRMVLKELEDMLGRGGWSEIMNAVSDEEVKHHMRSFNQGHFYIPSYIDVKLLTIHEKVEIIAMGMGCSFKEAHQIAKIFEERFRKYLLGSDGGLQDGIALPLPAAISHKEIVAVRTSPPQIIAEISTNGSIFPQTYYFLKLVQGPDGRVRGYLTRNSFKIWVDGEKELYPEYNFLNVLVEEFRYVYGQELDYLRQDHDFDRLLEHYENLLASISISQDKTEREKLLEELRNKFIKPYIEYAELINFGGLKKMNSDEKRKLLWAIFLDRNKEAVVKEMKKGTTDNNKEHSDYDYYEEEKLKAIDPETGDTITVSSPVNAVEKRLKDGPYPFVVYHRDFGKIRVYGYDPTDNMLTITADKLYGDTGFRSLRIPCVLDKIAELGTKKCKDLFWEGYMLKNKDGAIEGKILYYYIKEHYPTVSENFRLNSMYPSFIRQLGESAQARRKMGFGKLPFIEELEKAMEEINNEFGISIPNLKRAALISYLFKRQKNLEEDIYLKQDFNPKDYLVRNYLADSIFQDVVFPLDSYIPSVDREHKTDEVSQRILTFKNGDIAYLQEFAERITQKLNSLNKTFDAITVCISSSDKGNVLVPLAQQVSKKISVPFKDIFTRVQSSQRQKDLDYEERWENVKDLFAITDTEAPNFHGKRILVIDDIITTGATVLSLMEKLFWAGAREVYVISLGKTTRFASSAVVEDTGGIDLSQIELTLKDEKYVSSLNPADLKVLRAAKALKDGWVSLSLLYVHEIMLLLKDNLINDLQNKSVLSEVLKTLKLREFLDPQAINFLSLIQAQRSVSEIKLAPYRQFP